MTANYPLTLLYDAGCPVCSLEMDRLRERNHAGALRFVDIAAPGFDPAPYGVTLAALNAEIHGVRPDGSLIRGVPVLRLAYTAAGLGWVVRPTGWAPLQPVFDALYRVVARNRQPISRVAAPLIDAVRAQRARRAVARMGECSAGEGAACGRHHAHQPKEGRHTTGSTS
jgi:predicted DCC family thiol-disulfide oxidoreductase YuxK